MGNMQSDTKENCQWNEAVGGIFEKSGLDLLLRNAEILRREKRAPQE
jgi:hypothetical protein